MMTKQIEASQGTKHIISWVDTPERIKPGYSITLKGKDGWWHVDAIHEVTLEKSEINRSWHVGGL
jgi:hypothetical protein